MIENIIDSEIKEKQALDEVESFVTKIWQHPLLDERTIEHRKNGLDEMNKLLQENNLEDSFAVLVGSSIWITTEKSDWDFILYQTNPDTTTHIDVKNPNINIIERRSVQQSAVFEFEKHFDLLVTPDEYIAGNVNLARRVRHLILSKLVLDGHSLEGWKGKQNQARFDNYFRDVIRGWYAFLDYDHNKAEERTNRVKRHLEERAKLSNMSPEKYYMEFNAALNRIKPPDINTFCDAMQYTKGALNIDVRKSAQNISTLTKE